MQSDRLALAMGIKPFMDKFIIKLDNFYNNIFKMEKIGMNIIEDKEKRIYRNEKDGKVSYLIGLSKKKEDGTYETGYINCRFKKDVSLEDKTKIIIKNAWLDFFKIEKRTLPYIFISEFEKVEEQPDTNVGDQQPSVDNWGSPKDIEPEDLPFY